jgi:hypothetical protein
LVNNGNPGKWSDATLMSSKDRRAISAGRTPAAAERKFIRSKEIKMYANRLFTLLVVVALASIAALTVQEAVATQVLLFDTPSREAQRKRTLEADLARWNARGEYYENVEAGNIQRSRNADTARWMGQAEFYLPVEESQNLQRSRAADTARWTAMGEQYRDLAGDQVLSRAQSADSARWIAMSEYYQKLTETEAQNLQRGRAADAARWSAMAEYYTEWIETTR